MKIITWNVNGIRAVAAKWFLDFFTQEDADVFCIQEPKAFLHQVPLDLVNPLGYHTVWHEGKRPWYAWTAIFTKKEPTSFRTKFDNYPTFDEDGRVTEIRYDGYTILNVYFPNGQDRADGSEMLTYKLKFYDDLMSYIAAKQKQWEKIIVTWDFNICHTEIDIARPKENENNVWFLPVEREKIGDFINKLGLVDTFRYLNPDKKDEYTWWSYRAGARPRNVGWRLDCFMVDKTCCDKIVSFQHRQDVMGSDHCPVELVIN